jgi:hypothetical protein
VLRVSGVSLPLHNSIEPALLIGSVVHSENGTVRFMERVRPLDHISITSLLLLLNVSGVLVFNSVFEGVLRVVLIQNKQIKKKY